MFGEEMEGAVAVFAAGGAGDVKEAVDVAIHFEAVGDGAFGVFGFGEVAGVVAAAEFEVEEVAGFGVESTDEDARAAGDGEAGGGFGDAGVAGDEEDEVLHGSQYFTRTHFLLCMDW
jgi:hypothetical protein